MEGQTSTKEKSGKVLQRMRATGFRVVHVRTGFAPPPGWNLRLPGFCRVCGVHGRVKGLRFRV